MYNKRFNLILEKLTSDNFVTQKFITAFFGLYQLSIKAIMNKFVSLAVVFAALFMNASVSAIQCYQGSQILQNGVKIGGNSLQSQECSLSFVCQRIDISASAFGQTGKKICEQEFLSRDV